MDPPRFQGYDAIRKDRPKGGPCGGEKTREKGKTEKGRGRDGKKPKEARRESWAGGVMILVREGLAWCEEEVDTMRAPSDTATEVQCITIYPHRSPALKIVHIYSPPGSIHLMDPARLPQERDCIILGDVNRHHERWDLSGAEDRLHLGRALSAWADTAGYTFLNDGSATRQQGGRATAPDVTICQARWAPKCRWEVLECIGSDHLPVQTDVQLEHPPIRTHRRPQWSWKKAQWPEYTGYAESLYEGLASGIRAEPTHRGVQRFTAVLMEAAKRYIPKGCGRPSPKVWWSDACEQAVQRRRKARSAARRGAPGTAAHYLQACKDARKVIRRAKAAAFHEFASTLDARSDAREVWGVVHAMDGATPTTRRIPALIHEGEVMATDERKAAALVSTYAEVCRSRAEDPAEERRRRQDLEKRLRGGGEGGDMGVPFTPTELDAASTPCTTARRRAPTGSATSSSSTSGPSGAGSCSSCSTTRGGPDRCRRTGGGRRSSRSSRGGRTRTPQRRTARWR